MYVSLTQPTWPPSPPPTSPMPLPRRSPPLPYTTLFRSSGCVESAELGKARRLDDATGRYIEFCKSTFPGEIDLKGLKRSEEHTSELQSRGHLVCSLLLETKKSLTAPPITPSTSPGTLWR